MNHDVQNPRYSYSGYFTETLITILLSRRHTYPYIQPTGLFLLIKPKRHHWWPMAQSRHWTDSKGLVYVARGNGTMFRANPLNIGVESELYTRFSDEGDKDTSVEEWFAETIDGPVSMMINHILDPSNTGRHPFRCDPRKAKIAKDLGFRVNPYVDRVHIPSDIRQAVASYVAALLVRHPNYPGEAYRFPHRRRL